MRDWTAGRAEQRFPWLAEKEWLDEFFPVAAARAGASADEVSALVASLGPNLREAVCYFDAGFRVWMYEFGEPLRLTRRGERVWGPNCHRLSHLVDAMRCALARVPDRRKRATWFARLDGAGKHRDYLAEMMPMAHCAARDATYEVAGFGVGNCTVDWMVEEPGGGRVLIEVKQRILDLVKALDHPAVLRCGPVPRHDPELSFRDVQEKFLACDPDVRLQGAWVGINVAQEGRDFVADFAALDPARVHFAIFGDFDPGVHILVRRERDRERLVRLLGLKEESRRFVSERDGWRRGP